MSAFGRRRDGPGGRRTADREQVQLSAAMLAVGASRTAIVRDVSQTGLKLEINVSLSVGQEVWLKLHPYNLFGRVMWVDGNLCGVKLDEPFSPKVTALLQAKGKTVWMPRLSKEEQLALADWRGGTM
jgi:hypothetical protein